MMTRNVKVFLSLFMVFCMLSVFATVALAEPEESSSADVSSAENTSSEDISSGDTPSVDTSSGDLPPAEETRKVRTAGDLSVVFVYFNGANGPATEFDAPVGQILNFRVEPLEGYQVDRVEVLGFPLTPDMNGVYSLDIQSVVSNYIINITASPTSESSDEPLPSDDPSSDEPNVSGEPSDDSSEEPTTAELRVTVTGAGTVTAKGTSISNSGDVAKTESVQLEIGVATDVTITPAYGYKLASLKLDGRTHALDEQLTLTITALTTLELVFEPDTIAPTAYQVLVSCATAGGYVSAGGYTVTSGNPATIGVSAGGSLTISVYPADGYQVDAFRVGGAAQNLQEGAYVLENIAANTNITVSFKAVTTEIVPLEATDFIWTADSEGLIVLDIGTNIYIGRSVFDKINTLTEADGSYVVLKTPYIQWYIPCGGQVSGVDSDYIRLSVALNANGSYYPTIEASIHAQDPETVFQYYELSETPDFPEGTLASFNLTDLATTYGGNGVDLMVKAESSLKVAGTGTSEASGWTSRMTYRTSRFLVVRIDIADRYTIEVSSGLNGRIDPAGSNSVTLGSDSAYTVTPSSGYIIAAVYVDGVPVAGAAGQNSFLYTFTNVTANHTIRAEFIPSGSDYAIVNNVAVVQNGTSEEPAPRSHTGLIVALIIVFVAIAGAAALFIVKWRQEKF